MTIIKRHFKLVFPAGQCIHICIQDIPYLSKLIIGYTLLKFNRELDVGIETTNLVRKILETEIMYYIALK